MDPGPNVPALDGLCKRSGTLDDYRSLAPNEEPEEPYFMIFMRPTTGEPYYGW